MKYIWTNGCFDILHRGHIEMLKYAKSLGGLLVVGIDSDEKVARDKGFGRPINSAKDRKFILESIEHVDHVVIFNSKEDLEELIKFYKPDVMVIGSDWKNKRVIGASYAAELEFFDRVGDYSTTNILERQ